MKEYIGTKRIKATPMTRAEYSIYRGWELPEDENGEDIGYLVEYMDGGKPNDSRHEGYISWSPELVFHDAYHDTEGEMTFGHAIQMMKAGFKVARRGWNGKGMFLFLVSGSKFKVNRPPLLGIYEEGTEITYQPHIDMKTTTGEVVPWLASQTDMLAIDWGVVKDV